MGNFTWKQRYFSIFKKLKYLSSNVLLIIFSIIQWFLPQKWSQIWHFFSDFWDSASLIDSLFRCRIPHSVLVNYLLIAVIILQQWPSNFIMLTTLTTQYFQSKNRKRRYFFHKRKTTQFNSLEHLSPFRS